MSQPNKIPLAFASSGDKNAIPESTETTGLASWREGFPAITSAPFLEGGIAPKRADFNGIFYALSQAVMWLQQGGVYAYDVNTDYEAGNVVLDAGGLYIANAGNGPSSAVVQPSSDTIGATWKLVRLDLATQIAAGYMSAADKTKLDGLISTNATQSAAGYMSAEDKAKLDGIDLTPYALLNSPAFTGTPTAPTPATSDSSTKLATTAFVNDRLPFSIGQWTPVLRGGTTEGSFSYADRIGLYVRIGTICCVHCGMIANNLITQPSGAMFIAGLPYVSYNGANVGNFIGLGNGSFRKIFGGSVQGNSNWISLWANNSETPTHKDSAVWGTASDRTGYKIYESSFALWLTGFYLLSF